MTVASCGQRPAGFTIPMLTEIRSDDRFTFKPKLGTFIVRTALLRRVDVVLEMVEEPVCPGFTSVLVKYFDLSDLEFTHIMNAIVHEYKDNE